jgi:HEAT repeat protein
VLLAQRELGDDELASLVPFLTHPRANVRLRVASVLYGQDSRAEAANALVALLDDADVEVRLSAAERLLPGGRDAAVSALVDLTLHHDPAIRARAASVLARQDGLGADVAVALARFVPSLTDNESSLRSVITRRLSDPSPEVAEILAAQLQHPSKAVRLHAAECLIATDHRPAAVAALGRLLDDTDPKIVQAAGSQLAGAGVGRQKSAPALVGVVRIGDPASYVRTRPAPPGHPRWLPPQPTAPPPAVAVSATSSRRPCRCRRSCTGCRS